MTRHLSHPTLERLLSLWREEIAERGESASLGTLTTRDIEFFRRVFKDGFVVHGPREGPFHLTFVGTDLEALLGRKLTNAPFGFGLPPAVAIAVENAFSNIARGRRPLLIRAELLSSKEPSVLEAEILCVPMEEPAVRSCGAEAHEGSIFGLFTIIGVDALPAEPTHPKLEIVSLTIL